LTKSSFPAILKTIPNASELHLKLYKGVNSMSHIHIPDGIIPSIWWVSGYILTAVMLFILIKNIGDKDMGKKIPLAGMSAAIMLVGMSIPLGFLPLHFSLAVLVGILVGPSIGFIVVFTVNVILALFGHGGITIVGINTLVIGSEVIIGYFIFKTLAKNWSHTKAAAVATVMALLVSLTMMVGIVGATVGLPEVLPHGDHAHGEDEDEHLHEDEDEHLHEDEDEHLHEDEDDHLHEDEDDHLHDGDESFVEVVRNMNYFVLTGWAALITILLVGIAFEATVTALITRFLSKVRPDLLDN